MRQRTKARARANLSSPIELDGAYLRAVTCASRVRSPSLAACLHRWDDAERHFADALAMNERLGARPYVVRTRRAWASMLLDRGAPGDVTRAGDLIAAGRPEAETLGMARELVRFERLSERLPA